MTKYKSSKKKLKIASGNRNVIKKRPIPAFRLKFIYLTLCVSLFGLILRAGWLQIYQSQNLKNRARSFQIEKNLPLGLRRSVVDRNGKLIAIDEVRYRVWAHPKYFNFPGDPTSFTRLPNEVAKKLSLTLPKSQRDLKILLKKRKSGIRVGQDISAEMANDIKRLQISGVDLEPYAQRIYPQGNLFANVIGFLDQDRVPQAGLEQSLNKEFKIEEKAKKIIRGADGTPLPDELSFGTFNKNNKDIELTIDSRLQKVAYDELMTQIKKWNAKKGVAIVLNSNNGEILALASPPSYDPNEYWKYSPNLFREWSVQDLFEPGSVFKPINLLVALEEGVINPYGTVFDSGSVNVGGWKLKNWNHKANGLMTYPRVLQVSSNVGMVNIMKNLSPEDYWKWLKKLELDQMPSTDLPGAIGGQIKEKSIFLSQPIHQAVASFGQGFSITPLKLAQLHALIANGGKLVQPHITKDFLLSKSYPSENNQIINPVNTKIVLEWMESVVDSGSGKGVKTPGYRIAGKTGTADKSENGFKYTSKICSFVAILPVNKPKFVVVVAVDEPTENYAYGSTVAVPVAQKIIDSLLVLEKIPPEI